MAITITVENPAQSGDPQTVYLVRPRLGGFGNDVVIQVEKGPILYHVKSSIFSPLGRKYTVYDDAMQEVLRTEQNHTAIFPRHTMYQGDRDVGKLGQDGIIPQKYFIHLQFLPRAELHIGGLESIFHLTGPEGTMAEIAQHRSTWIVVVSETKNRSLILAAIAIIYRENTIGG